MFFIHHSVTEIQPSYIDPFLFLFSSSWKKITFFFFTLIHSRPSIKGIELIPFTLLAPSFYVKGKENSSQVYQPFPRIYMNEKLGHLSSKLNCKDKLLIIR